MTIKILYVIPPYFEFADNSISNKLPSFTIPYGIMSIDSYIKKNIENVESCLLDFNVEINKHKEYNIDTLKNKTIEFKPDVVAISALFDTSYNYLDKISTVIKNISKSTFIIVGGGLPTNLYEKILNDCSNIDMICYGEGEIPIVDLLRNSLLSNDTFLIRCTFEHKSLINRKTIKEEKIPINSFVYNLDDIPEFNYNLINLDDYNSRSLNKDSNTNNKREMSIHTSRGCPFNCVFCSNGKLHGKKVRYMSVERVVNEIRNMIKNYNLTTLMIEDDHFLFNKKRAKEILKQISQFNIKIEFPNGIAVYSIDEEIGKLLKKAGTSVIALAVESGSDYVLKNIIDKPHTSSMIKPKVEILRKNNIQVQAFIVIGLPGETDEHRLETLNMLKKVGFDWVHIFLAIPIVGSRLYDICIKNNYLITNENTTTNMNNHITSKACIKTPTIDPIQLEKYAYFMNLDINFVHNYNIKRGNYEKAKSFFENVVKRYPNHAFAYYYLSEAQKHLGVDKSIIKENCDKAIKIIKTDKIWNNYAKQVNII